MRTRSSPHRVQQAFCWQLHRVRMSPKTAPGKLNSSALPSKKPAVSGLRATASTSSKRSSPAQAAVKQQDDQTVAKPDAGAHTIKGSEPDPKGFLPLIMNGSLTVAIKIVEQAGDQIDTKVFEGEHAGLTALQLLVPGNANVSYNTPGAAALITVLLDKGASPDVQHPRTYKTPIMYALEQGQQELALQLINKSKNVNIRDCTGQTALSQAVMKGYVKIVNALLSAQADVATEGGKLLKEAIEAQQDEILALLIKAVPSSQVQAASLVFTVLTDKKLYMAALAYMERFEAQKLKDGQVDEDGNTFLHKAAESGLPYPIVTGLVKLGLSPDATNQSGDTPLHVAARAGHVEACRALVDCGADILKRNSKNRRAREQPKVLDAVKEYLLDAEETAKQRKANKQSELWDDKMKATQTESAFGLRCL